MAALSWTPAVVWTKHRPDGETRTQEAEGGCRYTFAKDRAEAGGRKSNFSTQNPLIMYLLALMDPGWLSPV
jgi:hypothetical protein